MGDDYLWDGTGEADPDVAHLEAVLAPHRYRGRPPEEPRRQIPWGGLALAAAVLLVMNAVLFWQIGPDESGWQLVSDGCRDCTLAVGEWIEPDEETRLLVADIGHVDIAPTTRVRIKATGPEEHRLELAHGSIHAQVLAPPRLLVVETPAATAVDLGCEYDLEVDREGNGWLTVQSGWVALESSLGTTTVVAGSSAPMRKGEPPGIPRFLSASVAFSKAADRAHREPEAALAELLRLARPTDTLTLFHMLPRLQGEDRERALAAIERIGPGRIDRGLDRGAVLALDPVALEQLFGVLMRCCFE